MSMPSNRQHASIEDILASDAMLSEAVLDMQDHNGTLVALIHPCVSRQKICKALCEAWPGDVEMYCATDLMVGGSHRS